MAIKAKQNKWKNPLYAYKQCMRMKDGNNAWMTYRSMRVKTNPFGKAGKL